MTKPSPWIHTVTFAEVARGLPVQALEANERVRKALARDLNLVSIEALTAEVAADPWLDGAELRGRFNARVIQTCSVSADDFEETVAGDFTVHVLPPGSPNAPVGDSAAEVDLDPEADDPPDVAEGETIDLAHYVIEHLALALDPFPRKPGAVFEPPPEEKPTSPFAVLRKLRPTDAED
jgi:uncharacterized metal-binding protein YceD (DUF177 family)